MFGGTKNITDRLKDNITKYVDTKFEEYRSQIAVDLAKGLASLAGLIAIWTLAIVCVIFVSFAVALLLGWVLSHWMQSFAYVLSFLLIAVTLLSGAFFILINKEKYIEIPVYKTMSATLRANPEETEEIVEEWMPDSNDSTSNNTSTKKEKKKKKEPKANSDTTESNKSSSESNTSSPLELPPSSSDTPTS